MGRHIGPLARLARACARHRWITIGSWVVAAVVIAVAAATVGGTLVDEFTIPNSDAQRAQDLLEAQFPSQSGEAAQLVFATESGKLDEGQHKAAIDEALQRSSGIAGVVAVGDPFAGEGGAVSESGQIAFADVQFDEQSFEVPLSDVEQLEDQVREAVDGSGVEVQFTGPVIQNSEPPDTGTSELIGIVVGFIILLLVLRTVLAGVLPIVMALIAVVLGLLLLTLAAALTNFNTITPVLATMLGLGVGIDYSLFILTRYRQALAEGAAPPDAAAFAASTAGRAVVFAGITVAVSISSLAVIGIDFITKLGLGAAITVLTSVLAAITLLPALLSLLSRWLDFRFWRALLGLLSRLFRFRWPPDEFRWPPWWKAPDDSPAAQHASVFGRWGRFVTKRPWVTVVATLAVLGVLALPVLSIQIGSSDAGTNPPGTTTRQAYDLLAQGFGPGFNGPLIVAVSEGSDPGAADALAKAFPGDPDVASVPPPVFNESRSTAVVTVFPKTSPQSSQTSDLVERAREDIIPGALAGTDAVAYVGGQTAAFDDAAAQISDRAGYFLLAVIGITFLLLSMTFRSAVIPIKASLTTLLSALAAFGLLTAVFQWGWLQGLIGLDRTGPIESFLPVIVFSILFGLSMDYEVFLVSRIRELYTKGAAPRDAVTNGVAAIGKVVAAAALIMSVVFLSFMLGDDRIIKEFGLALGAAVLIDAFVVRLTLVPALMYLLDERAWYMPRWLDWALPDITIEPPEADSPVGEPVTAATARPESG